MLHRPPHQSEGDVSDRNLSEVLSQIILVHFLQAAGLHQYPEFFPEPQPVGEGFLLIQGSHPEALTPDVGSRSHNHPFWEHIQELLYSVLSPEVLSFLDRALVTSD